MPTAELKAQLTGDNKPFENALDKTTEHTKKKAKEMEGAFEKVKEHFSEQVKDIGIGLAAYATIDAFKELIAGSIEFGSALQDASERLDISTDSLQGLGFAFGQSGAMQEDFEKGMLKLNVAIAKARDGDDNLIDSFKTLHVSLKSLEHDDPETILLEIADGMKNAKEPTEALAAAMEILGKTGIKLVPGLKGGSEELEELAASGAKVSHDEIEALDAAGDAWAKFARRVKVAAAEATVWVLGMHPKDAVLTGHGFDFKPGYKASGTLFPGDTGFKPEESESFDEGRHSARGRKLTEEENEKIEEANKEEEEANRIAEKSLERQQKEWLEISKINEDIFRINEETSRQGLSDDEMRVQLQHDRYLWAQKAAEAARDELGLHQRDEALALKHIAEIDQKLKKITPDQKFAPMDQPNITPADYKQAVLDTQFGAFKNFKTGPFGAGGGGLTSGGLTSGGLDSLGLNGGAHGLVRRGDSARAAAAMKAADNANAGVEQRLDEIKGLLGTDASPIKPQGGKQ